MDALTLLSLQIDWGADEALADAPVHRLANPAPAPERAPSVHGPRPQPAPPAAQANAGIDAVAAATTLDELRAAIRDFTGCALRETATHPVLAEGSPAGGLLIIGEPPVAEDDRAGRPFSSPAGTVLDRILAALGRQRADILLAPLIPWRPPGNRPPTDAELAQCLPLLHRLIALAQPRRIVLTGILPVRALLGGGVTLRRNRGKWLDLHVPGLPAAIPALPSAGLGGLKTATDRRDAWADWRSVHHAMRLKS